MYEDKDGGKFTVATAKNGDTFKVESMTMTKNGAGSFGFSDVGGRVTPEELGSIKDMNKTTFGDVMTEAFSPENIKEQSELFRVDGNAFSNFLVDMTNDTVDGYASTVEDAQNGDSSSAAISGVLVATKLNKILPKKAKEFLRTSFSKVAPATSKQLQKKFKHAEDFGVSGNYNAANAKKFNKAIQNHMNARGTKEITGTYRGNPVTFHTNPNTGLTVIQKPNGSFLSGWKLNSQQLDNVLNRGKL